MHLRLKRIRQVFDMTQGEFAEKLDITQAGLSGMEVGRTTITTDTTMKLVEAFNVSPNYLLLGIGHMFLKDEIGENKVSEPLAVEYASSSSSQKDYIAQLVQIASKMPVEEQLKWVRMMML